jgi:hypothetical protein
MEGMRGKRTFHVGTTPAVGHEVTNCILHCSIAMQ